MSKKLRVIIGITISTITLLLLAHLLLSKLELSATLMTMLKGIGPISYISIALTCFFVIMNIYCRIPSARNEKNVVLNIVSKIGIIAIFVSIVFAGVAMNNDVGQQIMKGGIIGFAVGSIMYVTFYIYRVITKIKKLVDEISNTEEANDTGFKPSKMRSEVPEKENKINSGSTKIKSENAEEKLSSRAIPVDLDKHENREPEKIKEIDDEAIEKYRNKAILHHSIFGFFCVTAGLTAILFLIVLPILVLLIMFGVTSEEAIVGPTFAIIILISSIISGILAYYDAKGRKSGKYNAKTDTETLGKWESAKTKIQKLFYH